MPSLLQVGDLHVNQPLTTISTAYLQSEDAFISDKVFPTVSSQFMSGQFWRWPKGTFFRTDVERRGPGAPAARVGWGIQLDSYLCDPYAIAQDIPDMHRANADSNFNMDRTATLQLTRQHLLHKELLWANTFFKTGVWGTDYTGVASGPTTNQTLKWSVTGSDPINFMQTLKINQLQATGVEFNTLVITLAVLKELLNHPLVIDRIKYTQTAVPQNALTALTSLLDVPRILVAKAVVNRANDTADSNPPVGATGMSYVFDDKAALYCYTPASPSIETPASGYTFAWTGMFGANAYGMRLKKYRDERLASDAIEAESAFSHKLVSSDLGVFLSAVI